MFLISMTDRCVRRKMAVGLIELPSDQTVLSGVSAGDYNVRGGGGEARRTHRIRRSTLSKISSVTRSTLFRRITSDAAICL